MGSFIVRVEILTTEGETLSRREAVVPDNLLTRFDPDRTQDQSGYTVGDLFAGAYREAAGK